MTPTAEAYPRVLLALCLYREARGESRDAKIGVKHVILNRLANPKPPYAHCDTIPKVILDPKQFSSFNRLDPNSSFMPLGIEAVWLSCCEVVDTDTQDPTGRATHYYSTNIPPPKWADPAKFTVQIGAFRFYEL